jgi:hypothetical protein
MANKEASTNAASKASVKANHAFPEVVHAVEKQAQTLGLAVTLIRHPLATGELFEGAYSGIPTEVCAEKEAKARLSSGEWIDI